MIVHTAHRGNAFSASGTSLVGHVLYYGFLGNGILCSVHLVFEAK